MDGHPTKQIHQGIGTLLEWMGMFSVKSYLAKMEQRREYFAEATSATKALHLTMIAPYGIANNSQSLKIQSVINMDDLCKTVWKNYVKLSAAPIAEAAP